MIHHPGYLCNVVNSNNAPADIIGFICEHAIVRCLMDTTAWADTVSLFVFWGKGWGGWRMVGKGRVRVVEKGCGWRRGRGVQRADLAFDSDLLPTTIIDHVRDLGTHHIGSKTGGSRESIFGDDDCRKRQTSEIGTWLTERFKKGGIKGPDYLEGCKAEAASNGDASAEISQIAKLKSKQDAYRDSMRPFRKKSSLPPTYIVECKLWDHHNNDHFDWKLC